MSIRQYIPVKAATLPDPATYCPAFGYDLPVDPNIVQPDPTWYPTGEPVTDEIILTVSDNGDRRIAFYATVESPSTYTVDIYGVGGVNIKTQNIASGTTFGWQLPDGGGVAGIGQTTFKVRITPTTGGKHITGFKCNTYPTSNPVSNWQILYAKFNTPNIIALNLAFSAIDVLQGVQFFSSLNSLTTLANAFYGCISLKSIEFPNMPALTTLAAAFSGCYGLTSCKFGTLPVLQSLNNTFYGCSILPSQVYPTNMPELLDMTQTHYNNTKLKSVTLPTTAAKLNTMASCFCANNSMLSITMPTTLPLLANCVSTFASCRMLTTINFCSSVPSLSLCSSMCYGDQSLRSFTFPATQNALTKLDSTFGYCYAIKTVVLPTTAPNITTMYQTFYQCYEVTSITMPTALTLCTTMYQICQNCYQLTSITYPPTMDACLTWYGGHFYNSKLANITMPTSMNACTTIAQLLQCSGSPFNLVLTSVTLPASMNALISITAAFAQCNALTTITMPTALPAINDISSFSSSPVLASISACTFPTTQVNASSLISSRIIGVNFPTLRATIFSQSSSPLLGNAVSSVTINWANSSFSTTGSCLILNYLNLSAAALDAIFTALPVVTARTVNVQFCTGSAGCTPTIATAKGWTVLR